MRLSFDVANSSAVAEVVLSRRNLLALLLKLDEPESFRRIESNDCPNGWRVAVLAEDDDEHYGARPVPPGPMHPATEAFIAIDEELRR